MTYKTYYGGTLNFNDAVKCSTLSIMTGKDVIGRLVQACKQFRSFRDCQSFSSFDKGRLEPLQAGYIKASGSFDYLDDIQ